MTMTASQAAETIGASILANLSVPDLYERAIRAAEGVVAADGPLVVSTGKHTGRSPQDKFIVSEPWSHDKVWWGSVNREISEEHYDRLRARLLEYVKDKQLYAQDMYIGAHEDHRRSLRVYTEFCLGQHLRPQPLPPTSGRRPGDFRAQLHDHQRAQLPGGPGDRGHAHGHGHPAPPAAHGDHHRRLRLRR